MTVGLVFVIGFVFHVLVTLFGSNKAWSPINPKHIIASACWGVLSLVLWYVAQIR